MQGLTLQKSDRANVGSLARLPHKIRDDSMIPILDEVRLLLDQGLSGVVQSRLRTFIKTARRDASLLAKARCALSISLEMQGRYREALEAVAMYDSPESVNVLDVEARASIRVQVALAHDNNGDHPRAIALLKTALREADEKGSDAHAGSILNALAAAYRNINEYTIAREHALQALERFRHTGDWRGMAESYFGIALAELFEGSYEKALEHFEQALKLIGDRPASYLLGKIYNNMAGAYWFLKRPLDGIQLLEKAIAQYERCDHRPDAINGYNNLGNNLILAGKWGRAEEALDRALALASELDAHDAKVSMILDSLGKLRVLRGDLDDAEELLERAVRVSAESGNKWYEGQARRSLSQCRLAMDDVAGATSEARRALSLGERIGDRRAICESRLLLAEAGLAAGELGECETELLTLADEVTEASSDLDVVGEKERVAGILALARRDEVASARHFGRSASVFALLGDRYRTALANSWLGRAALSTRPDRAAKHLRLAAQNFRELGARADLARAEELLAGVEQATGQRRGEESSSVQSLVERLLGSTAARELLLRELAGIIRDENFAERVLVTEPEEGRERVVFAGGWPREEAGRLAGLLSQARSEEDKRRFAAAHHVSVMTLRPGSAPPATVMVTPAMPNGSPVETLLRVAELGMDACALRNGARAVGGERAHTGLTDESLGFGFIHSSPAMTRLVEEVHKIRSSDVTVLITGESGTGKELVARAIHALSSRRNKVFVPFNCTAVPKELSEGYLFGYRRGAFTGAVSDSPGVIRSAAGGTLFLDEVGDLSLDIQPKLLRFLQEGEIQPLGEQRPSKVDVRIVAATNTDLEGMVAGGEFREDLFYRLNVIRLRVPPLRERRSEIPSLVHYYIDRYSRKFGRRDVQISPETVDLLMVCDWPGNVRQLTNEIQRIVARAEDGALILPDHLSPQLRRVASSASEPNTCAQAGDAGNCFWGGMTIPDAIDHLERLMVTEALNKHGGNVTRAARDLGMTRRGLQLKLGRYKLGEARR